MEENNKLKGLHGWLLLVGIGLVVTPFRLIAEYLPLYNEMFTNGSWELLTTEGSNYFIPYFGTFMIVEMFYNIFLVISFFYLTYLFFKEDYRFPKLFIAVLLIQVIFIFVDAWLVSVIMPAQEMFSDESTQNIVQTVIYSVIWVPYMFLSKRVKATFAARNHEDFTKKKILTSSRRVSLGLSDY